MSLAQRKRTLPRPVRAVRRVAPALAGVLVGLVLLSAGWDALNDPHRFPIAEVKVSGEVRHVDPVTLRTAVTGAIDGGFFGLDVERIQRQVQQLAWVDQVWVRRVWPDGLEVRVKEQVPLAHWGASRLVNARGEVFDADGREPAGLPRLQGPDERVAAVAALYLAVERRLRELNLQVSALSLDERAAMRVGLAGGVELVIGRKERERRLARFIQVYPKLLASRAGEIARIDLRYGNGFAVQWKNGKQSQTT